MGGKRILIFNDAMSMGGTEILLVDILKHLDSQKCIVTLLLPIADADNVLLDKIPPSVTIKYLHKENSSYWKKKLAENLMIFFPRLFSKLKGVKASDYDRIVCFKDSFYACIFHKMKVSKTLWIHNILYKRTYETSSTKERLAVWLNKKQLKKAQKVYKEYNKVVCVSDACKDAYINVLGRPKQDIRVLYNAIDLSKVSELAKEPIESLPQGIVKFILITRASPEKRVDRLLNAANRLKLEKNDFHVYIIGEGLDNSDMRSQLITLNLTENISLLGRVENPYPYILQSNWLLCVSERESFSLVLLEAISLKTPVITTDCGGPANIIDGGKYGILVDNSAEGVYEGMKKVMDDPTLSVKYSSNLDEVLERFDYRAWLDNIDKLLDLQE